MSDTKLTTGEKLLDLRKKAKLTSERLCHELENKFGYIITKSKYNEIENDKPKDFGYQAFLYLAKYYNVSVDWLLGLAEAPTTNKNIKMAIKVTGLSQNSVERLSNWNEDNFKILDDLISTAKMNHITYLFDELQKASNLFIAKGIPYLNNIADMRNDETAKELVSLIDKCDSITGKANKEFVKLLFLYDEREKNVLYNNIFDDLKLNGYIE